MRRIDNRKSGGDFQVDAACVGRVVEPLRHTTTKLGASATTVASDAEELRPICQDVEARFLALAATLEALLGAAAGRTFRDEVVAAGGAVARALEALGGALASDQSSRRTGEALERLVRVERVATSDAAAVRKVVIKAMKQIRDARRELDGCQEVDEDDFGVELDEDDVARVKALALALDDVDAWWKDVVRHLPSDVATLDAAADLARRCAVAVDEAAVAVQLGDDQDPGLAACLAELRAFRAPPSEPDLSACFA